jgi:hypothetical protein
MKGYGTAHRGAPRMQGRGVVTGTTGQDVRQQRIAALEIANAVRREKAQLKGEIAETKLVGELTERQRELLADQLRP